MTTKTDMERIGLFQEMGYVCIGDKYVSPTKHSFNEKAEKGRQMLGPHSKIKCGLQDGYFDKKFTRIFEGEGFSSVVKRRRLQRLEGMKFNMTTKPFVPPHGNISICGVGNYYGSFSGVIDAFSPTMKVFTTPKTKLKNVLTNPGKKGTGYGYQEIGIGPYPKNQTDPYSISREVNMNEMRRHKTMLKGGPFKLNMHPQAYFDANPYLPTDKELSRKQHTDTPKPKFEKPFKCSSPGKPLAGDKSGTFEKYPTHSTDIYKPTLFDRPVTVVNKTGKLFYPNAFEKSRPVNSVITQNVLKEMNVNNRRSYNGITMAL